MQFVQGKTQVAFALAWVLCQATSAFAVITVNVPAGGNIQAAVNQVKAAGGGTVNLAAGQYTLTSTVTIPSNITLSGAGTPATTISATGQFTLISTDAEGQSNMKIRNMKLVGSLASTNSNGIIIQSLNAYHSGVTISNVQIMNCGGMGCHLKRVNGISITDCNFHDNGTSVYMHNLYIRTVTAVTISNTLLNKSRGGGTGLHIAGAGCNNITVTGCTANDNTGAGMNVQDTPGAVSILSCNASNNGDDGLSLTGTNMKIDRNTCLNNEINGVHTWGGTGNITNCTANGNAANDYEIHGTFSQSNNN